MARGSLHLKTNVLNLLLNLETKRSTSSVFPLQHEAKDNLVQGVGPETMFGLQLSGVELGTQDRKKTIIKSISLRKECALYTSSQCACSETLCEHGSDVTAPCTAFQLSPSDLSCVPTLSLDSA